MTDPRVTAARHDGADDQADELAPARGVLVAVFIGGMIWAVVGIALWAIFT